MDRKTLKDWVFLNICTEISKLSYAKKAKVGCVIARDGRIITTGFNGTPEGHSNECEKDGITLPNVIHAEMNAILFAARVGVSIEGATLYCNWSPCPECCKMIANSGIVRVVVLKEYRDPSGLKLLNNIVYENFENVVPCTGDAGIN